MKDIYGELQWRGLIHQTTDEAGLPAWLQSDMRTVYAGFDPTSDSLHVGNLMPLMLLRRFQQAGHRPIAVAGGATGMIGDPSGKSAERNLLTVAQLNQNLESVKKQLASILDFDCGENSAILVNNFDWMSRFSYLDFLREVGKNFPVNVMLAKESVRNRLDGTDAGLSYTEFSYMLLQAYDFVHLFREYGCEIQVGGSDQWGNITAGIDLGRRMCGTQFYGLTCPLLTKSDGSKMGKTESGAVWMSPDRTSPYQFYQYWINVADEDAGKCLRFLTELDREDIEGLEVSRRERAHVRESQRKLAEELTRLIHGDAGLATARRATEVFFGAEISGWHDLQLNDIFADVPSTQMPRERLAGEGIALIEALAEAGLAKSKSEARRIIQQGGAYVNNRRQNDVDYGLTANDLASETVIVLRSGKKKYALLKFTE